MIPRQQCQAHWERMEPATQAMEQEQEQAAVVRMVAEAATVQEETMEPREDMQVQILSARVEHKIMVQAQHQEAQHRPIIAQA